MRKALQPSKVRTDEQGKLLKSNPMNAHDATKSNVKVGDRHATAVAQSGKMLASDAKKTELPVDANVDKDAVFAEMRGNPIYSPDDSLAKAASKLATLKSTSGNVVSKEGHEAIASSTSTAPPLASASAPKVAAATAQVKSQAPQIERTTAPKQLATPGSAWRPQGKSGTEEVPLAARTLLSKRNRRKSVYQRPARYGDWFDGDDEELEKMVHDFNGDEQEDGKTNSNDIKSRSSKNNHLPVAGNNHINGSGARSTKPDQHKERAARRKSAFPIMGRSPPPNLSQESESPRQHNARSADSSMALTPVNNANKRLDPNPSKPPANTPQNRTVNTAQKIRAMAAGLCNQLDGLIEESPAVPRGFSRFENKSLRDKLVESWQGRSYYERLMQMAGVPGTVTEVEGEAKTVATIETSNAGNVGVCQDALEKPEHVESTQEGGPSVGILGFLSPPKPRRRVAEGQSVQSVRAPYAIQTQSPERGHIFIAGHNEDILVPGSQCKANEIANAKNPDIEESVDALRATIENLQLRLEDALEEAKTEEAARKAAEKRIEVLEAELEKIKSKQTKQDGDEDGEDTVPRKTVISYMQKVSDKAAEMEGRWGLVEAQLDVIGNAVKLLNGHVTSGRAEAQTVIDSLLTTFAPPHRHDSSSDAPDQAGQAARRSRARRKSTWRG
jgi:hypothetical protein